MVINFVKNGVVPQVFSRLPFGLLQKLSGAIPLIPYYHLVSDDEVPHVKHLYQFKNVRQFRRDLDTFLRFYQPTDLCDLVSSLRTHRWLPKNSFLLTFDDGFREQYDVVAPILWEKGITATFFVIGAFLDNMGMAYKNKVSLLVEQLAHVRTNTHSKQLLRILADWGIRGTNLRTALLSVDYAKKDVLDAIATVLGYDFTAYLRKFQPYLTSEQVCKLIGMGFTIGAHSVDHPQYSLIPFEEQLHQTRASVRFLRERFSLGYGAFAFPHGYDNISIQFFKQIFADGEVDASFGNFALRGSVPFWHFRRFSMEKTLAPAERTIGRYYAQALYDFVLGRRVSDKVNSVPDSHGSP
jgi:peptidoglycan/xylan/chitin deacetylase (PgdA/CDA1 family)